ncbi:MAG TPA: metallophosphoesterase, partial [Candidatus Sumerlaeota bacterium]|nr:metallophosphoesterase [Candidatus Sumerlaeota bacterium]
MRRSLCFSGRVSLTLFGIFLTILCAAAGAADFRVKPYVQNPATDAMTVIWFSDANTPGVLEYQSTPLDAQTTTSVPVLASALAYLAGEIPLLPGGIDPGPPYKHQIRLKGLSPDTRYDYRVNQGASETTGTFKTSPAGLAPVRFIVYADSETEPESTGVRVAWPDPTGAVPGRLYYIDQTDGYHANLDVIESREPDFIVISGDLAQSGGEQRDWDEFWLHNRGNRLLAGNVPILAAPGNHEYYGGTGGSYNQPSSENAMAKFRTYFDAPANNSPNPLQEKRYSRVDYGPVTIIILDVVNGLPHGTATDSNWYILGETEGGQAPDFNPGSRQYQWL